MRRIFLYLWLAIFLASCEAAKTVENTEIINYFKEVPPKVDFRPGQVAKPIHLDNLPGTTLALLPVKSTMGGGMGEEVVTEKFYQSLVNRFKQIRIISDKEASKSFTGRDLWDAYYEGLLTNYYQVKTVQVAKLVEIYRHLNPDYLIGITADYTFVKPTPPRSLTFFIYVQIWDAKDGRLVWEGQAQGEDVSQNTDWDSEVIENVVKSVCQEIVGHM